jgi:hypothetical protein
MSQWDVQHKDDTVSVYCEIGRVFEYNLDALQASEGTNRSSVNCRKCSVITAVDYFC